MAEKPNPADLRRLESSSTLSAGSLMLRLLLLGIIDAFVVWFILELTLRGFNVLAITFALLAVFFNIVILHRDAYPLRWMVVGLVLMALFAIYPIFYTGYISTTNYGFGHLLTKEQAIDRFENTKYLPEGSGAYTWTAFRSEDGDFALWLQREDGQNFLAYPDQPLIEAGPEIEGVGGLDAEGIPLSIKGYERLNRLTAVRHINELGEISFGAGDRIVLVSSLDKASELVPLYVYSEEDDLLINQQTGVGYRPINGAFTSDTGERLTPGFQISVGLDNFVQFIESPALQGPLVRIIIWNFAFAFLSVLMTFSLGLFLAIVFNDPMLRGRRIIQTLLLIPYTIPSLITIMVWRGLLNPELGIINETLRQLIGWAPPWFTSPWWSKGAILLVNLWLGFPYFMLICSGALQGIPTDLYDAANVDGAGIWQQFWNITLPMLLVAVGPLLVASFVFNFNNFNIIFLFIEGGPPIVGASTEAGHTDILISYVYNLAFAGGRGAQYGLAAAITFVIFVIVAALALFQFRFTRMWEEVSENV
ncbi:MAG: maltose ABC transporter permease MalF [Anaerolineales bacterium]|nr:maltose ABC transporter permease MalF [Anaerolineales bacterium]